MVYETVKGLSKSESIGNWQRRKCFLIEENGLCLHVRLKMTAAEDHTIEITTKEQVFVPENHLGYIRVKGITFEFAGNGNPVPQKGLVSTCRGHHWIIEIA